MGQARPRTSWTLCLGPVPGRGQAVHGCHGRCLSQPCWSRGAPRLEQPFVPLTAPWTPWLLSASSPGPGLGFHSAVFERGRGSELCGGGTHADPRSQLNPFPLGPLEVGREF